MLFHAVRLGYPKKFISDLLGAGADPGVMVKDGSRQVSAEQLALSRKSWSVIRAFVLPTYRLSQDGTNAVVLHALDDCEVDIVRTIVVNSYNRTITQREVVLLHWLLQYCYPFMLSVGLLLPFPSPQPRADLAYVKPYVDLFCLLIAWYLVYLSGRFMRYDYRKAVPVFGLFVAWAWRAFLFNPNFINTVFAIYSLWLIQLIPMILSQFIRPIREGDSLALFCGGMLAGLVSLGLMVGHPAIDVGNRQDSSWMNLPLGLLHGSVTQWFMMRSLFDRGSDAGEWMMGFAVGFQACRMLLGDLAIPDQVVYGPESIAGQMFREGLNHPHDVEEDPALPGVGL